MVQYLVFTFGILMAHPPLRSTMPDSPEYEGERFCAYVWRQAGVLTRLKRSLDRWDWRGNLPHRANCDVVDCIGFFPQMVISGLVFIALLVMVIAREFDLHESSPNESYTRLFSAPVPFTGTKEIARHSSKAPSMGRTTSIHIQHNDMSRLIQHLNGEFVYPAVDARSKIHRRNVSSRSSATFLPSVSEYSKFVIGNDEWCFPVLIPTDNLHTLTYLRFLNTLVNIGWNSHFCGQLCKVKHWNTDVTQRVSITDSALCLLRRRVHHPYTVYKPSFLSMPVGIEAWVTQIPPITRGWLTLAVLTSLAVVVSCSTVIYAVAQSVHYPAMSTRDTFAVIL